MWNFFGDTCEKIREIQEDMLETNGYHWEKYTVTTEDGYINTIYRIPYSHNIKTNNNERRPPVILSHGMTCCSAVFLNQCQLGYYLADQGYDVWLPNNRGTTFSRKHVILDPEKDKDKYWNFSWHEIGVYDIPAFVDLVIEKTSFQKVYYIGHSQGTTALAVFLSERPEYNDKIMLSCLMGSVISMDEGVKANVVTLLKYFMVPLIKLVDRHLFRIHVIPFSNTIRAMSPLLSWNSISRYISMKSLYYMTGYENFEQATQLDLTKFCQTMPNTSSIGQLLHYMQNIQSKKFTKYDYGPEKNLEKYGSTEPPLYDLKKVTSPVALFYGKNDMFNNYKSDNLDKKLGNVVYTHVVEDDGFNHIDFLIAKDSVPLLYKHIVEIMKRYQES